MHTAGNISFNELMKWYDRLSQPIMKERSFVFIVSYHVTLYYLFGVNERNKNISFIDYLPHGSPALTWLLSYIYSLFRGNCSHLFQIINHIYAAFCEKRFKWSLLTDGTWLALFCVHYSEIWKWSIILYLYIIQYYTEHSV